MSDLPELPWFAAASKRCRYLVAVSGGADSVALLHLLLEHGFRHLIVCHLDHALRGRASTADAAFVRRLADRLELPAEIQRERVAVLAENAGLSIEVAARQARHRFFAKAAAIHGASRVILGHHADDQCETVLFNLCRGSAGLKGMSVETSHKIEGRTLTFIRPLLDARHRDLVSFLETKRLSYQEDASNLEGFTPRNRLRHEAIPLLNEICGRDVTPLVLRAAAMQHEQTLALAETAAKISALDPQGRLHLATLAPLPRAVQRHLLHRFLKGHKIANIDHDLLDRGLELISGNGPAKLNLPGNRFLRRKQRRAFIE